MINKLTDDALLGLITQDLKGRIALTHQNNDGETKPTNVAHVFANRVIEATRLDAVTKSLQEMVDMMNSGDERGAGSDWHIMAVAALRG